MLLAVTTFIPYKSIYLICSLVLVCPLIHQCTIELMHLSLFRTHQRSDALILWIIKIERNHMSEEDFFLFLIVFYRLKGHCSLYSSSILYRIQLIFQFDLCPFNH